MTAAAAADDDDDDADAVADAGRLCIVLHQPAAESGLSLGHVAMGDRGQLRPQTYVLPRVFTVRTRDPSRACLQFMIVCTIVLLTAYDNSFFKHVAHTR